MRPTNQNDPDYDARYYAFRKSQLLTELRRLRASTDPRNPCDVANTITGSHIEDHHERTRVLMGTLSAIRCGIGDRFVKLRELDREEVLAGIDSAIAGLSRSGRDDTVDVRLLGFV